MRNFEPVIDIKSGNTYNFVSGSHPYYDGNLVRVKHYYRPGHFAPNGLDKVLITIPTVVGSILTIDGKILCEEIIFPAVWCV